MGAKSLTPPRVLKCHRSRARPCRSRCPRRRNWDQARCNRPRRGKSLQSTSCPRRDSYLRFTHCATSCDPRTQAQAVPRLTDLLPIGELNPTKTQISVRGDMAQLDSILRAEMCSLRPCLGACRYCWRSAWEAPRYRLRWLHLRPPAEHRNATSTPRAGSSPPSFPDTRPSKRSPRVRSSTRAARWPNVSRQLAVSKLRHTSCEAGSLPQTRTSICDSRYSTSKRER